jgi:hypothetical protein
MGSSATSTRAPKEVKEKPQRLFFFFFTLPIYTRCLSAPTTLLSQAYNQIEMSLLSSFAPSNNRHLATILTSHRGDGQFDQFFPD